MRLKDTGAELDELARVPDEQDGGKSLVHRIIQRLPDKIRAFHAALQTQPQLLCGKILAVVARTDQQLAHALGVQPFRLDTFRTL